MAAHGKRESLDVIPDAKPTKEAIALKDEANAAFLKEDLELAREKFSLALDASPGWSVALANRSAVWLKLGKYEEAANDAREALRRDPGYVKCLNRLATACLRLGRVHDAVNAADRARVLSRDERMRSRAEALLSEALRASRAVDAQAYFEMEDEDDSSTPSKDTAEEELWIPHLSPRVGVSNSRLTSVARWGAFYRCLPRVEQRFCLLALCWNLTAPAVKLEALHAFVDMISSSSTPVPSLDHLTEHHMLPLPMTNYEHLLDHTDEARARFQAACNPKPHQKIHGLFGAVPLAPIAFFAKSNPEQQVQLLQLAWEGTPTEERKYIMFDLQEFYGPEGRAVQITKKEETM